MRFASLFTAAFAAFATASPIVNSGAVASNELVTKDTVADSKVADSANVVARDNELLTDIENLVGDFVYDIEGLCNLLGFNVDEIFNAIGLQPPASRHGEVVDGAKLIFDIVKDLIPIATSLGVNFLKTIASLIFWGLMEPKVFEFFRFVTLLRHRQFYID